jgi:subtilisin family serine protease
MPLRFRWKWCVVALPLSLLLTACSDPSPVAPPEAPAAADVSPSFAQTSLASSAARQGDHYLIVLKDGAQASRIMSRVGSMGGKIRHSNDRIGVVSVQGLSDQAAASLATDVDVESVARDVNIQWLPPARGLKSGLALALPLHQKGDPSTAPGFPFQWNLRVIRADAAWKVTKQGGNTLVCILDTGTDPTHADLQGRIDLNKSVSFVESEPDITDFFFHGTAVSSIITTNGLGIASVAPLTRLCVAKVLDKTGAGSFDDIITGIIFATDAGADVINMSLGVVISTKDAGAKQLIKALQRAVKFATKRGVLVVAAAGNEGIDFNTAPKDLIALPAMLDGVLSVGATAPINQQNFDLLASYTNFGGKGVNVFAPGGDLVAGGDPDGLDLILAACSNFSDPNVLGFDCRGNYLLVAGTSFSSPHTAAEGAIIDGETRRPDAATELTRCIELGADAVTGRRFDPVYAWGRINVLGGVNCRRII